MKKWKALIEKLEAQGYEPEEVETKLMAYNMLSSLIETTEKELENVHNNRDTL